jgi:Tfp pilus assembly protein PilF
MLLSRTLAAAFASVRHSRTRARVRAFLSQAESRLRAGDISAAEVLLEKALSIDPAAPDAHGKLALLLTGSRRIERALYHYRAAQRAEALTGEYLESFVRSLIATEAYGEAETVALEAVHDHPSRFESWFSAGLASLARHHYAKALERFERALEIRPENADAHANRGIALQYLARISEACAAYDAALAAEPGHALARFHRSLALLISGDYERGWPQYETRLLNPGSSRADSFPRWDGSNPNGRRILVYGEQGLGDEIMFASCLPDLLKAGAQCAVECHPALEQLFKRSFPDAAVYAARPDKRVPETIGSAGIGCAVPFGSLPLYYRRSVTAFPEHRGYLRADPDRVLYWRERVSQLGGAFTVGISWKGGTYVSRTGQRSIPLEQWLPMFRVPGLRFVSLQYTKDAARAVRELNERHNVEILHWPEAIEDYDETAALVTALDLTVTVCTAVAHLCGALGRPLWIMAPTNPEWRYGHAGDHMVWYPSARMFRQTQAGHWSDVLARVGHELRQQVAKPDV